MLGFSENASAVEMPESGVKSRQTSILKEFKIHDKNIIHLPRHYFPEFKIACKKGIPRQGR
jgi:hypothetical protein